MKLDKYGYGAMRGALLNKLLEQDPEYLNKLKNGEASSKEFADLMKNTLMLYNDVDEILKADKVVGPSVAGL